MKKAFTLAEVLITLGVVAVVAVLTIPQILSNIEKRKTVAVLKRAYSDLYKYLEDFSIKNECNDSLANCAGEYNEFIDKFSIYLLNEQKFLKTDRNNGIIYFDGKNKNFQIPGHFYSNARDALTLLSPNGQYIYGIGSNLNDKQFSIFWNQNVNNSDPFRAAIIIITNPNKYHKHKARMGHDIFIVFIMQSKKIVPNGAAACGTGNPWYGWCYYCKDWKMMQTCNPENSSSDGWGCLQRIIDDGWNIKYF